eukprot:jgi/Mesen1/3284/ME001906S02387
MRRGRTAVPVAICAALGNGLQGWDNAVIAGSLLYIVPEFHLESNPSLQGNIVSASLIGAVISTLIAGPAADWVGRRVLLLVAAVCFAFGSAVECWSPSISVLVAGRSLNGFSVGLIATVAPLFIAECSPAEIRGQLATLPQLMGITGMVASYATVFALSLGPAPNWRFMLGLSLLPASLYLALVLLVLPESPRWLVSKGRIHEARAVLESLRDTDDVTGELALLVEGLGVAADGTVEEWVLKPLEAADVAADAAGVEEGGPHALAHATADAKAESEAGGAPLVKIYGQEDGTVWIAQPLAPYGEKEKDKDEELGAAGRGAAGEGGGGGEGHAAAAAGSMSGGSILRSLGLAVAGANGSLKVDPTVSLMEGLQHSKELALAEEHQRERERDGPRRPPGGGTPTPTVTPTRRPGDSTPTARAMTTTKWRASWGTWTRRISRGRCFRRGSPATARSGSGSFSNAFYRTALTSLSNAASFGSKGHQSPRSPFSALAREQRGGDGGGGGVHFDSMSASMSAASAAGAAGGWQVAWQVEEHGVADHAGLASETRGGGGGGAGAGGNEQQQHHHDDGGGGLTRVFILQEASDLQALASSLSLAPPGGAASLATEDHESFQAAVIVSHAPPIGKDILPEGAAGPAMVHPSKTATVGPAWGNLLEPGVRQALAVGVSLQALQQLCGINAVLYYTPAILTESGGSALKSLGLSTDSASLLASLLATLLMMPSIFVAMWLMDRAGRRQLLLTTVPVMTLSLLVLTISYLLFPAGSLQSAGSLVGLVAFNCSFVMGFGPVPNIICSEIFPTRVRSVCIGICALVMWAFNIAVSELFPVLRTSIGLGGVFGLFGIMSVVSYLFVWLRVPETKGLPLEVISEIFAISAANAERKYDAAHE